LVIRTLDPDLVRIGIQPKMLDPDLGRIGIQPKILDPYQINADPKHWLKQLFLPMDGSIIFCCKVLII
jgi:hypothetical protein